ncbi:hypothetical protein MTO96_028683 [Rhipicephalus appendiculatus]
MEATRHNDSTFSIEYDEGSRTSDYLRDHEKYEGKHRDAQKQPEDLKTHHRRVTVHFRHHKVVDPETKAQKKVTEVVVECLSDIVELARRIACWAIKQLIG